MSLADLIRGRPSRTGVATPATPEVRPNPQTEARSRAWWVLTPEWELHALYPAPMTRAEVLADYPDAEDPRPLPLGEEAPAC
jgi:hypothetical protein